MTTRIAGAKSCFMVPPVGGVHYADNCLSTPTYQTRPLPTTTLPTEAHPPWDLTEMTHLDEDPHAASVAFGLRMRELRARRGISQDALADRTDVHPTAIGRLERGAREPRLTTIMRIARGLEVPAGSLLEGLVRSESSARAGNADI